MGIMTTVYQAILALTLFLTVRVCLREDSFWKQATAALVVVPLLLRLLMVK